MALDFIAGCLGGCAGVLVGHPFDTAKVHLQTQDHKRPLYRGTYDCLKTIIKKDSVRGLYRGMSSPMSGVAFVNAIVFGVYGNVQRNTSDPDSLYSHFMAGAAAGLIQSVICSPMELAKTRLQLQLNIKSGIKYKGPLHCLQHIYKTEKLRGVFRGLGITAVRDVPGFSSYFIAYELMTRSTADPSAIHTLLAGGLAGTFSWIISFPIDVVKSRIQADGMSGKPQYNGIQDCIRQSYNQEGIGFLARGLVPTLIRAFPMNAACFFVVSWTIKLLGNSKLNLDVHQSEPLAVIGSVTLPFPNPIKHNDHHVKNHRKSHAVKSLIFLGAFSEAVCSSEIIELHNDLYDEQDDNIYYSININNDNLITQLTNNNNNNNNNNEQINLKTNNEHIKLLSD